MHAQVKVQVKKTQTKTANKQTKKKSKSGGISSRNHEENGIKKRKSIISEAITVLYLQLAKAVVWKTREKLDLMRQI